MRFAILIHPDRHLRGYSLDFEDPATERRFVVTADWSVERGRYENMEITTEPVLLDPAPGTLTRVSGWHDAGFRLATEFATRRSKLGGNFEAFSGLIQALDDLLAGRTNGRVLKAAEAKAVNALVAFLAKPENFTGPKLRDIPLLRRPPTSESPYAF